jgi:hypothetical protein
MFDLGEMTEMLVATARDFARDVIAPVAAVGGEFFRESV